MAIEAFRDDLDLDQGGGSGLYPLLYAFLFAEIPEELHSTWGRQLGCLLNAAQQG